MSEQGTIAEGTIPPPLDAGDGQQQQNTCGQRNNDRRTGNPSRRHGGSRGQNVQMNAAVRDFVGDTSDIGAVIALKNEKISKKAPFAMFREKLADYVIKTLTHPDDVFKIIKKMEDPEAKFEKEHMPTDLTNEEAKSMAKKSIFEQKCKLYVAREQTMKSNKSKIYSLIWGQCSPGLQAIIQGDKDFVTKEEKRDVLWVLEQVKLATAGIDERANQYENMCQVLLTFLTMRQGETESNDDYLERFKSNAETVKLTGGKELLW